MFNILIVEDKKDLEKELDYYLSKPVDDTCYCSEIIVLSDKALYRAKNLGRNRVENCVLY